MASCTKNTAAASTSAPSRRPSTVTFSMPLRPKPASAMAVARKMNAVIATVCCPTRASTGTSETRYRNWSGSTPTRNLGASRGRNSTGANRMTNSSKLASSTRSPSTWTGWVSMPHATPQRVSPYAANASRCAVPPSVTSGWMTPIARNVQPMPSAAVTAPARRSPRQASSPPSPAIARPRSARHTTTKTAHAANGRQRAPNPKCIAPRSAGIASTSGWNPERFRLCTAG